MFLTETSHKIERQHSRRKHSSTQHQERSQKNISLNKKFDKLFVQDFDGSEYKKSSKHLQPRRTANSSDMDKLHQKSLHERQWNKIVDLYNLVNQNRNESEEFKRVGSGSVFYKLLANDEMLKKYPLSINFPETFLEVSADLFFLRTNPTTGLVESTKIEREEYRYLVKNCFEKEIEKIRQFPTKYKKHYDFQENPHAPVLVTKTSNDEDENLEVEVESYKIFDERRSRPSSNKIIQKFIYPRNMKSMIFRICFNKKQLGEQREEFYAYRFQNIDNIFRVNKKNSEIYETFKFQSTICATYDRSNKVEFSKITNLKGLSKFLEPSKKIIWFLEQSQKIGISCLYIDFIVDLFDEPWLVNIKKIEYSDLNNDTAPHMRSEVCQSLFISTGYGVCKICSSEYPKKDLKKTISNKMLCEFLAHLKKRMTVAQYEQINFIKGIIKVNNKNYLTLQVCEGCYQIVAEEHKLIESEQKLASICNITKSLEMATLNLLPSNTQEKMYQWRLMMYFDCISDLPASCINSEEFMILKYRLGSSDAIENSWKVNVSGKASSTGFRTNYKINMNISKVKVHYFYSQTLDIDNFLKETEINLQLATNSEQKIFAKGSTGTLSSFRRQFHQNLCLRQTSSVLLFYSNGKYCEMTLKVGIICDGEYMAPIQSLLHPINQIYFADKSFMNSNPMPKEWMEAFGVQQTHEESSNFEEDNYWTIGKENEGKLLKLKQRTSEERGKRIERKSFNVFR